MNDLSKHTSPEVQVTRIQHNERRFDQLNGLMESYTTSAFNYLLAVNGGAAAGMLAFIGAKKDIAAQTWPFVVLGIFVTALLLVGIAHAVMVHKVHALIMNWNKNIVRYGENEISWKFLIDQDVALVRYFGWVPWVLGWLSLGLFFLGVILAAKHWSLVASIP